MNIILARVDERLVHGQIITSWTKHLNISHIVIVDDQIANDPFMFQVLMLSAPARMQFEVFNVDKAADTILNSTKYRNERVLLLFKDVFTAWKTIEQVHLPELNIGNVGSGPERKRISKNVSLTAKEIEIVKSIIAGGTEVNLQMIYTDPKVPIKGVLS